MMLSSARRVFENALAMFASDVVNRATTFLLYALVARYLSTFAFGQMSLALTFFYTSQVFAVAGLKTLITREVAKDRSKTQQYLVSGSLVVLATAILAWLCSLGLVRAMDYSADTAAAILLLALGLVPFALASVCEALFLAWERMRFVAYANIAANIIKVTVALFVLIRGYGLYFLMLSINAGFIIALCIDWYLLLKYILIPQITLDLRFTMRMLRATGTFLGIDSIIAIVPSINIILLSKMAGEADVGLYSAANQMMVPITLVYQSLVLSIFPVMCRKFADDPPSLLQITAYMLEILLAITLPTILGLFFLADSALVLLYGSKNFVLAVPVLQIMLWNLVSIALTSGLGQVLLASLREKVTLRIVAIDAAVGLIAGLVLISQFGLVGAAYTTVLVRTVDLIQHYIPVARQLPQLSFWGAAWRPAVASLAMAGYLLLAPGQPALLAGAAASLLYMVVLAALTVWSIGGPRQIKTLVASLQK